MKTISVGIIGWGFMGRIHTHALRSIPVFYQDVNFKIRLKCVCSRRLEKAREAMEQFGFECCTDDYRELLAMEDIDVVSICTPNELHEEMAIAALKAGKHVYIDKPLAVNGESAMRIAECAETAAGRNRVALHCRCYPALIRAKQLVDEGRIGNILQFEARYLHAGSIDPDKPIGWKQQLQGGTLLDMGSHVLDLVTWLAGYPKRVLCKTRVLYPARPTKEGGTETRLADDHVIALLEMENGAIGTVEASKIATGSNDDLMLELRGDRGALKFDLMNPNYLEYYDQEEADGPVGGMRGFTRIETVGRFPEPGMLIPKNSLGWDRGHTHSYYSFLKSIVNGEAPECTIAEAAKLQVLMDGLLASAASGSWTEV